jgi:hypothetical protein
VSVSGHHPENWRRPFKWAKDANGHRPRVFCASLADWLDNQVPNQWREDLAVVIEKTPWVRENSRGKFFSLSFRRKDKKRDAFEKDFGVDANRAAK